MANSESKSASHKAPSPWSIKGIDSNAREAAKAAAKRAGMTLGEWMTHKIIEEQAGIGQTSAAASMPRSMMAPEGYQAAPSSKIDDLVERMQERMHERIDAQDSVLASAVARMSESLEQVAARVDVVGSQVGQVTRVAQSISSGVVQANARVRTSESALSELRERTGAIGAELETARATQGAIASGLKTMEERLLSEEQRLHERLEASEKRHQEQIAALTAALDEMRAQVATLAPVGPVSGEETQAASAADAQGPAAPIAAAFAMDGAEVPPRLSADVVSAFGVTKVSLGEPAPRLEVPEEDWPQSNLGPDEFAPPAGFAAAIFLRDDEEGEAEPSEPQALLNEQLPEAPLGQEGDTEIADCDDVAAEPVHAAHEEVGENRNELIEERDDVLISQDLGPVELASDAEPDAEPSGSPEISAPNGADVEQAEDHLIDAAPSLEADQIVDTETQEERSEIAAADQPSSAVDYDLEDLFGPQDLDEAPEELAASDELAQTSDGFSNQGASEADFSGDELEIAQAEEVASSVPSDDLPELEEAASIADRALFPDDHDLNDGESVGAQPDGVAIAVPVTEVAEPADAPLSIAHSEATNGAAEQPEEMSIDEEQNGPDALERLDDAEPGQPDAIAEAFAPEGGEDANVADTGSTQAISDLRALRARLRQAREEEEQGKSGGISDTLRSSLQKLRGLLPSADEAGAEPEQRAEPQIGGQAADADSAAEADAPAPNDLDPLAPFEQDRSARMIAPSEGVDTADEPAQANSAEHEPSSVATKTSILASLASKVAASSPAREQAASSEEWSMRIAAAGPGAEAGDLTVSKEQRLFSMVLLFGMAAGLGALLVTIWRAIG
ncbi:MAG: hypothetical protein MRY63_04995 [Neomegalonema sp.]|nr:hypothetical protein [Neomegalonema sp.]